MHSVRIRRVRTAEFSFGCGRIEFRVEFGNELSPKKFAPPLVFVSSESNELEESATHTTTPTTRDQPNLVPACGLCTITTVDA